MRAKLYALVLVLSLMAGLTGCSRFRTAKTPEAAMQKASVLEGQPQTEPTPVAVEPIPEEGSAPEGSAEDKAADLKASALDAGTEKEAMMAKGNVFDFSPEAYAAAKESGKLTVLYFYANWCPLCKVELPRLREAFEELKGKDVVAYIVNFNDSETSDEETALAKAFGVPYQHTKVILKDGKAVLKAPDSWDKARYLSEVTALLK